MAKIVISWMWTTACDNKKTATTKKTASAICRTVPCRRIPLQWIITVISCWSARWNSKHKTTHQKRKIRFGTLEKVSIQIFGNMFIQSKYRLNFYIVSISIHLSSKDVQLLKTKIALNMIGDMCCSVISPSSDWSWNQTCSDKKGKGYLK